jgi:hypothetical protein
MGFTVMFSEIAAAQWQGRGASFVNNNKHNISTG